MSLNEFEKALSTAIMEGDINIINKVIKEILIKRGKNNEWLAEFLRKVPLAREKFFNYARRSEDFDLLDKLNSFLEEPINHVSHIFFNFSD